MTDLSYARYLFVSVVDLLTPACYDNLHTGHYMRLSNVPPSNMSAVGTTRSLGSI